MSPLSEARERLEKQAAARDLPAKILTLDIETSPNVAYTFDTWNTNVSKDKIISPVRMLSFAAKWYDSKKAIFYSEYHNSQAEMVQAIHDLLDEADIVITFNGNKFDLPHLNREMIQAGLTPPSPYKKIDLYVIARKEFNNVYNSLDWIATYFGIGSKVKHPGFELWEGCMNGDKKSWDLMKKYNIGDVFLTEKVYDFILPWIPNHPHFGLFAKKQNCCPNCSSSSLREDGTYQTNTTSYPRYQCEDCGKWIRGIKLVGRTTTRSAT